jgi:hypothetical protein
MIRAVRIGCPAPVMRENGFRLLTVALGARSVILNGANLLPFGMKPRTFSMRPVRDVDPSTERRV